MQNYQNTKYNNNTIFRNDKSDELLSLEYLKYLKNIDLNSANSEFVKTIKSLFKSKIDYFRGFINDEIFEFLDLFLELNDSKKRKSTNECINDLVIENEQLKSQNLYLHSEHLNLYNSYNLLINENKMLKNEIIDLKKKLEKSDEVLKEYIDLNSNLNKELIEYYNQELSVSIPIDLNEINNYNSPNISEEKYIENNIEKDFIDDKNIENKILEKSSKNNDHEYMGLQVNSWKNTSNCIGIDFKEKSNSYQKIFNKISFLLSKCKIDLNNFKNKKPIIPIDKKNLNKEKKYQSICYFDCFDHSNAIKIKEKIEEEKVIFNDKFDIYFSKPSWEYNKI